LEDPVTDTSGQVKTARAALRRAETEVSTARRRHKFYRLGMKAFVGTSALGLAFVLFAVVTSCVPWLDALFEQAPAGWFGGFTWPAAAGAACLWHEAFLRSSNDGNYVKWATGTTTADAVAAAESELNEALDDLTDTLGQP
jgi:hypothetical protein